MDLVPVLLMQRVEPLLCDDREVGEYTRAVSGQRLGKHVPAATNRRATTGCFYVVRAEEDNWGDTVSSV
jgi:hypothetical protein